jgi:hypothetical protein
MRRVRQRQRATGRSGLNVEERGIRSRPNNKGAHHTIWFAQKA